MAEANLKPWFKVEMTFEGGRVDDPADPGGRTAYGVHAASLQRVSEGQEPADPRRLGDRDARDRRHLQDRLLGQGLG